MNWKYIVGGVIIIAVVAFALWFIVLRPRSSPTQATNDLFGKTAKQTIPTITQGPSTPSQQTFVYTPNVEKRIFKIADGPIASAVYVQTKNPTTTVVRYIRQ